MNKKVLIPVIIIGLLLIGGVAYLSMSLQKEKQANKEMQELAEMDKKEMENEYQQFADQYSEMKTKINNDSLVAQLTHAREIARLKKELATCRAVIRSYILEIDSLNRLNQNLTAENTRVKGQYEEATRQIEDLNSDKASLSEKVAIAAQLDATGISMTAKKKGNAKKSVKKIKDAKLIAVNFNISKNVTAQNGQRTLYVRVTTPAGGVMGASGSFNYENRSLQYSMRKTIEYTGNETPVTMYWNVNEVLNPGTYNVSVFADGKLIGSRNFTFK